MKVARFWRPFRFLGGSEHRGQIPSQLNPESWFAALRSQDNRLDEPPEHLRGFQAGVLAPEGGGQFLHLGPVNVRHARVKKGRGLVGGAELDLERGLPLLKPVPLGLEIWSRQAVLNRLNEPLDVALHSFQFPPGTAQAGPLFHPQSVHLFGEPATELFKEVLAQQFLLQRCQHALFDFFARDSQCVGAGATLACAEAAEPVAIVDDEARATFAALRHAGEQILRADELVEAFGGFSRRPLPLNAGVARLHGLPQVVVHDAESRYLADHPLGLRIWSRDAFAAVRILQVAQFVPDHAADVQLVVKNADTASWVAMDRTRTPERTPGSAQTLTIEVLGNLSGRDAGCVVPEDTSDDVGFLADDLALAGRDDAVLECADDAVAETYAAAGPADFDASPEATPRLVRQLLQEHRVHRSLQPDVEERDVAFGESGDADAGEREALEETGGVFLVAAEAVERFSEYDVHLSAQRFGHHGLEARPHQRCAGDRVVRVLARDCPALLARELATDAELVFDRCFALVL